MFGLFRNRENTSADDSGKKFSDQDHVNFMTTVMREFAAVAVERGEPIGETAIKNICMKFALLLETTGPDFAHKHLEYEVNRFAQFGLREDYRKPLG